MRGRNSYRKGPRNLLPAPVGPSLARGEGRPILLNSVVLLATRRTSVSIVDSGYRFGPGDEFAMARASKSSPGTQLPSKPGDALAGEVALRAKVDQTGLTVAGRSRALAAADQLLGGLIGLPGGWLEGIRRRNELRRDARERYLEADIAAAMRQVEGLSDLGQATVQRVLREEYRKQDNRASVWVAAEEHLALPPPNPGPESPAEEPPEQQEEPPINPDWLNRFTNFAQDVSNEELQRVWGQILAGEIRKPGSFSISSLRVLAELDADVAKEFENIYRLSINDFAPRPDEIQGKILMLYADLEQAGLLHVEQFMNMNMKQLEDGFAYIFGEKFAIRVTCSESQTMLSFPIVRLTRVGLQIGSILQRDEPAALREIASRLSPVRKIELLKLGRRIGPQVNFVIVGELPGKA